jgi:uroporphyrinogen-III synthase
MSTPVLDAAIRLDSFDLAVFVSPNAIEKALALILARRTWPAGCAWPPWARAASGNWRATGSATSYRRRLRFDSEALLELPELTDVAGKRVIIFRGDGGRELLGDTLKARGASVEYLSCYRRARPQLDPAPLLKLWEEGRLDAVTLTSSEGLRNFLRHGRPSRPGLAEARRPPSCRMQRIAEQAQALGLGRVIPTGPGDDGLMAGLVQYFASHGNGPAN